MLLVFLILLNCCWLIGFSEAINKWQSDGIRSRSSHW
jgi:hypothetical protein